MKLMFSLILLASCTTPVAPGPVTVDTTKDSTFFAFNGPRFGFVYYPAKDSVEVWGRDTVGLVKHLVKQLYHCNEK